ncbi:helix-turn-helix transcriptional regulator [Flavobacterium sp. ZB4P13]|uniref:helix-turn-helix transcriptional regulator n=1 Tax=Flavobacterium sp. ZB4P13 TaxID=3401728 RepID=UPI003AAFE26C
MQELLSDAKHVIKTNPEKQSEAVVMQSIYDYILNHLEEPLPTLKKLAAMFASEEHKLKIGFRKYFNTSVYNFYHLERLKKSHLLIQQITIPLKEIAFMCGFSTYLNFYKAFKKHYGYAPSDLSRPSE